MRFSHIDLCIFESKYGRSSGYVVLEFFPLGATIILFGDQTLRYPT